jgi:hypothetical protein
MDKQNGRWDGLTTTGTLPIGVFYAGKRHKNYTLRLPMAGDLVRAQQEYPDGPLRLQALECYRQQLLVLGDIPEDALTTKLLTEHLSEIDLGELERADAMLGKRLAPPSEDPSFAPGGASSMPLSATATDSTTSAA